MLGFIYKILNKRKIFLLILFCHIVSVGFSQLQDYASIYEIFKPFKNVNEEYFYNINERKKFKIKKIIHKIIPKDIFGYPNLDSIYIGNYNEFKDLIFMRNYNFHCPSKEIFDYNSDGLIVNLERYPLTNYLTKQDSVIIINNFNHELTKFSYVNNVIYNGLKTKVIYSNYIKKDSIYFVEDYIYNSKNKKLKEVYVNNILKEKYFYLKNKTKIEYQHYDTIERITRIYMKENISHKNNIISSMTYDLQSKDIFYIGYLIYYDSHRNIVNCIANEFGDKYTYFVFENKYTENVLSQIVLMEGEVNKEKIIYSFYQNGLLKSEENNDVTETYEYEYF